MDVTEGAVAAARAWMRMPDDSEAATLSRAADTAVSLAEAFLGRALAAAPREDMLAPDGRWQRLRTAPVTGIAGMTAVPADAAPSVLATDRYAIDIDADGIGWVRIMPSVGTRVAVAYAAGLAASWEEVPGAIAQGIAMLTAHLFENRGTDAMPPAAVAALWRPYRRVQLAEARR